MATLACAALATAGCGGAADPGTTSTEGVGGGTLQTPSGDTRPIPRMTEMVHDYITENICPLEKRPTDITLTVEAGAKLLLDVGAGLGFSWDLETVCNG